MTEVELLRDALERIKAIKVIPWSGGGPSDMTDNEKAYCETVGRCVTIASDALARKDSPDAQG